MRIKNIQIDGFKSYSTLQRVEELDAQFNAITGLNGSGKSNILDSICFVLGITNLTHIRAGSMNDLVFKQGQTGVTQATVTIVFDNRDVNNRPLGYNQDEIVVRRQVIVNGRNSYTINGTSATNGKVADFFRSVGLNVNNPHFLIMQGRITKVLNMKPDEILGMVEEAAGTKMYDAKRQSALNIIHKKQAKVDEIDKLLEADIQPQIDRLKKDREVFLEYQNVERKLEAAKKNHAAFTYWDCTNRAAQFKDDAEALTTECEKMEKEREEMEEQLKDDERRHADMEKHKEDNSSSEKTEIESKLKEVQTILAGKESALDACKEKTKELKKKRDRTMKDIKDDSVHLEKQKAALEKLENSPGGESDEIKKAEENRETARKQLMALAQGMTTNDKGEAVTLESQITAARTELAEMTTNVKAAEMKVKTLNPDLSKKRKELASLQQKQGSEHQMMDKFKKDIEACSARVARTGYDDAPRLALDAEKEGLIEKRAAIETRMTSITQKCNALSVQYDRPRNGAPWDDSCVHGSIMRLFRCHDDVDKFASALECVGGGSLHAVVIEKAEQAQRLLQSGQRQRKTFLPLDSMKARTSIRDQQYQRAKQVAASFKHPSDPNPGVWKAIDLIEYDPKYETVMNNTFGNTLIVTSTELASKICFDRSIAARCVTLDGDDLKPSGVVSAGQAFKGTGIIVHGYEMYGLDAERKEITARLQEISKQLEAMQPKFAEWEKLSKAREEMADKLQQLEEKMKFDPIAILQADIVNIEKELPTHEAVIKESQEKAKSLQAKIKEFEEQKKNKKAFEEKKKKEAEKMMKDAEAVMSKLQGAAEQARSKLAALKEEIANMEAQLAEYEKTVAEVDEALAANEDGIAHAADAVAEAKAGVADAQAAMDAWRGKQRAHDEEMKKLLKSIEQTKKAIAKKQSDREKVIKDVKTREDDIKVYEKAARHAIKNNGWIEHEKDQFGVKGSGYEFEGYTMEKGKSEVEAMEKRFKELASRLNTKAMQILGQAESQVATLVKKKEQIHKDKTNLMKTIEVLDKKKEEEIIKAHEKVNKDFGNIFGTLLPGTDAKLEPPPSKDGRKTTALDGLEVKVAFNGQWKEHLGELSGGQKSLVALSLVLAMLKFKPAPIYILDEVDAALDLSHTQNIGAMIKKHFTNSQFIIVSLKEGMFNHANVLYRTKFSEGTSQITRIDNTK